jgi:hypothetical protein
MKSAPFVSVKPLEAPWSQGLLIPWQSILCNKNKKEMSEKKLLIIKSKAIVKIYF